jgi:O-antigen ligase
LALNGLFNAGLAFYHLHAGWTRMYGRFSLGDKVFGSFGYPNHGAMYFLLLLGMSTGLVLRELRKDGSERSLGTIFLHAVSALAFASAACLSTSRAGLLGTFLLLFGVMAYMVCTGWRRTHPVQKINWFLGMAGFVGLCAAIFLVFAGDRHFKEVKAATSDLDPQKEFNARIFQSKAAWAMWRDHRWHGVGAWGYKWLAADYHPPEEWKWLRTGKANVHNDYLQFLAEFGIIGITALLLVFGTALLPTLKSMGYVASDERSLWGDPMRVCLWVALCIVGLDALIDLPFRSPAVFMHFAVFLAFLSLPNHQGSLWAPPIDWNLLSPPGVRVVNEKKDS